MEKLADSELHQNVGCSLDYHCYCHCHLVHSNGVFWFLITWQAESVYSKVLYSLIHNISCVDSLPVASVQKIFDFMQNACQLSDEQHQSILEAVKQQAVSSGTRTQNNSIGNVWILWFLKPPDVSLDLEVIEARSLKPKDVDGMQFHQFSRSGIRIDWLKVLHVDLQASVTRIAQLGFRVTVSRC